MNDKKFFWTTLPGILTGIAAVITAIAALIGGLFTAGVFDSATTNGGVAGTPVPTSTAVKGSPTPERTSPATVVGDDCFEQFFNEFPEVPEDRKATVEEGANNFDVTGPPQPADEPVGIVFTDLNVPIGAIKIQFFPNGGLFKVLAVVNSRCEGIEDYESQSGSDKNVVKNFSRLKIRFGDDFYELRLQGNADIDINFVRVAP